jgi:hypothetical protein
VTDALFRRAMLLVDRFYREADAILSKASEIRSIDEETTEARRRGLREFFGTPREVLAEPPLGRRPPQLLGK